MLSSLFGVVAEVGGYWQNKAYSWWTTKTPRDALLDRLEKAETFEEWEQIALKLDEILGYDLWRQNASDKHYDYRLIYERQQAIIEAHDDDDVYGLVGLLRSGLVRNLGNITAPNLFNGAYAGTKLLIEDYITQVALAIQYVTALPPAADTQNFATGLTAQSKLDLLHDTRQAFGRSTLVLQGGAIFGICHLGVVKALHLRGLLPRIVTGTATGALIAALVGIHTEDELLDFLDHDGIDFAAFSRVRPGTSDSKAEDMVQAWNSPSVLFDTIHRRTMRYFREGYFLDVKVLEDFVKTNVGDMTFLEAYARTKRVLNITIATSGRGGVPNLLNYLTSPNVLIYSAAVASNASSNSTLYAPVTIKCKDEHGNIVAWSDYPASPSDENPIDNPGVKPPVSSNAAAGDPTESPLARVASLFNVNHFIVSQARPYVLPFISASATSQHTPPHPTLSPSPILAPLLRLVTGEVHHRLTQLDECGFLPPTMRKLLLDEAVPNGSGITLVPSINAADYLRLLDRPGREEVDYWIRRGERSVWPAISALRIRCAVEVELDRGYQLVRRRKPLDGDFEVLKVEGRGGR